MENHMIVSNTCQRITSFEKTNIIIVHILLSNFWNNSDVHQFHRYQQKKQSPLFLSELTWYKMTTTYYVEGPGPVADLFATTYFVSYWQNYLLIWGVDFSNIYHVCSLGAINVSCFNLISFTYICIDDTDVCLFVCLSLIWFSASLIFDTFVMENHMIVSNTCQRITSFVTGVNKSRYPFVIILFS
jgi:L-asparagine transporter-like permease